VSLIFTACAALHRVRHEELFETDVPKVQAYGN
jgi:hypothetical protein